MKISEAFQMAIDRKIPQMKGDLTDGKGSYCAKGLLSHFVRDTDVIDRFEDAVELRIREPAKLFRPLRPIAYANDEENWTWENFRDYSREWETKQ